jgi:hypothetical protein
MTAISSDVAVLRFVVSYVDLMSCVGIHRSCNDSGRCRGWTWNGVPKLDLVRGLGMGEPNLREESTHWDCSKRFHFKDVSLSISISHSIIRTPSWLIL